MSSFSCQPLLDKLTHVIDKARLLETFKCLTLLEEKIQFCLSSKEIKYDEKIIFNIRNEIVCLLEALYEVSYMHGKSEDHGEKCKTKGSKAYLKRKDIEAHKLYTEGLRFTPSSSKYLPLLYANRSAVLYQINSYRECLLDIERAIATGYPNESQNKLTRRKIESLIKLGLKDEARHYLNIAQENMKDILLESQEAKNFSKTVKSMEDSIRKMKISNIEIEGEGECHEIPFNLFADESKSVSQMSGALELSVNNLEGRHITAITDIPKGSVVFKERPFASILLPEYFLTHCQNCYIAVFNPIPCDNCSDIIWCSPTCKADGAVYHKYECKILHILTGVGIAHLALRIVLVAGWQTCFMTRKQFPRATDVPQETFKINDKESRYQAVYSLLTHLNETVADDQFQYALAAIILGKAVLERSDFSSDQIIGDVYLSDHDSLIEICCIIMHHIAQLVSNAHAITQVNECCENDSAQVCNVEQKRIASAIYPSASLMNHSCMPAIINCFQKDLLIIHTIREIKAGEQVYNCYGPHAYRQDREERQATLSRQYFFKCKCPPCTLDEFLVKEISWNGLICPNCGGIASWTESVKSNDNGILKCLNCNFNKSPPMDVIKKCSSANQLFQEGEEAFLKGDLVLAEKNLLEAFQIGIKVYVSNNYFLNSIRDTLAKIMATQGKYAESLQYLLDCIENIKLRYGDDSIEVAHELIKYQDIANLLPKQEKRKFETDDLRKQVEDIFSTHYGPFWKKHMKIKPF